MSELISSAEALQLLGVRSRQTLSRIRKRFPRVALVVPGMVHPRYRRTVLLQILAGSALDAPAASGEGRNGIRHTGAARGKDRA